MYIISKIVAASLEAAAQILAAAPQESLAQVNWPEAFPYAPTVRFAMAHDDANIYIRFFVDEATTAALEMEDAHDVYKDSCVEMFLMPSDDGLYYNFEFNAAGTLCYSCRPGRQGAVLAPVECHAMVKRLTSLPHEVLEECHVEGGWSLTAAIPLTALFKHGDIRSLSGRQMKMNCFKCGDALSTIHYITWHPIATQKPDYHRPEYFVAVKFE